MKHFNNINTIEELKKEYRQLCKKFHPDLNRDIDTTNIMKEINNEYEMLFKKLENNETKKAGHNIDDNYRNIINSITLHDNIDIELVGFWIWVSGNTFEIKEQLKELGFMFSGKHKKWFYNGDNKKTNNFRNKLSYDELKDRHGYETIKTGKKLQAKSK